MAESTALTIFLECPAPLTVQMKNGFRKFLVSRDSRRDLQTYEDRGYRSALTLPRTRLSRLGPTTVTHGAAQA